MRLLVAFQVLEVAHALGQAVGGVNWPVTHLGVQVVVQIAFPGWQSAVVGSPHGLQADHGAVFAGSAAQFV